MRLELERTRQREETDLKVLLLPEKVLPTPGRGRGFYTGFLDDFLSCSENGGSAVL